MAMAFVFVVFSACEDDEPRTSVLGVWNCDEYSEQGTRRNYQVTIANYEFDTNFYKMYNFHNLGDSEHNIVICEIDNDGNLIIENQLVNSGMYQITDGKGIVADDLSRIKWTYYFTGSSVTNEYVTATYY